MGSYAPNTHLTVIDFPQSTSTFTYGSNDQGQVVGDYADANGNVHGFIAESYIAPIVFDVPGNINLQTGTQARSVNSLGDVVGWFTDIMNITHAFSRSKEGEFTQLDITGATYTNALGNNARGDIVGAYKDATGQHGYLLPAN